MYMMYMNLQVKRHGREIVCLNWLFPLAQNTNATKFLSANQLLFHHKNQKLFITLFLVLPKDMVGPMQKLVRKWAFPLQLIINIIWVKDLCYSVWWLLASNCISPPSLGSPIFCPFPSLCQSQCWGSEELPMLMTTWWRLCHYAKKVIYHTNSTNHYDGTQAYFLWIFNILGTWFELCALK